MFKRQEILDALKGEGVFTATANEYDRSQMDAIAHTLDDLCAAGITKPIIKSPADHGGLAALLAYPA